MNRDGYRHPLPELNVLQRVYNPHGNRPIEDLVEEVAMALHGVGDFDRAAVLITSDESLVDQAMELRNGILADQLLREGNINKLPQQTRLAEMIYLEKLAQLGWLE